MNDYLATVEKARAAGRTTITASVPLPVELYEYVAIAANNERRPLAHVIRNIVDDHHAAQEA